MSGTRGAASATVDQAAVTRGQRRRAVIASTVGTTIEWYDFFLYGTAAALVFPSCSSPSSRQFAGILRRSARSSSGSRPGRSGRDLRPLRRPIGRKTTLVATLMLMGIAHVPHRPAPRPTRLDRRARAPMLLVAAARRCRASASAASGAARCCWRWSGARRSRRGLMASWPQFGVPMGLLLSTGAVQAHAGLDRRRLQQLGLADAVPAQRRAGRHRPVRPAAGAGEPGVRRGAKRRRSCKQPVLEVIRTQPLRDPHVGLRPAVRAGAVLPVHHVRADLRHEQLGLARGDLLNYTLVAAAVGLVTRPAVRLTCPTGSAGG